MSTTPIAPPRIQRFENLAYGLFVHWGLFSQFGKGEWVYHHRKLDWAEYSKAIHKFTADQWDPHQLTRLARDAGAKYITLVTRHHEGFSLYDTKGLSEFDVMRSPAGRDLVREFIDACREDDILPVLYHTTLDWRWDSAKCSPEQFEKYLDYLHASVELLCTNYGPIGGFWFDGNWTRKDIDWKEDRLYSIIRKHQPEAMIINNTSTKALGKTGHPEIDSVTYEQGIPGPLDRTDMPRYITGEMCQTMNHHWGIAVDDYAYLSPADLIKQLSACRRVGANFLLNIGPTAGGGVPDYEGACLRKAGGWVHLHAKALYEGKPTPFTCNGKNFVLQTPEAYYLFCPSVPINGNQHLFHNDPDATPLRTIDGITDTIKAIRWLDNGEDLKFEQDPAAKRLTVHATDYPYGVDLVVRVAELVR